MGLTLLLGLSILSGGAGAEPPEDKPSRRTDRYGDPLPADALIRLGSLRLRHGGSHVSVAFAPDGKLLASRARYEHAGAICLWDTSNGREVRRVNGRSSLEIIGFTPDAKSFLIRHINASELWNATNGEPIRGFTSDRIRCEAAAMSADGKLVVTGGRENLKPHGNVILLWEFETGKIVREFIGHKTPILAVAISSDGKLLASGAQSKTGKPTPGELIL
jgi:WD40 repeat protein